MPRFEGTVSHYLRQRRLELNLRQRDVAEALDVTPDFICLVEAGERRFDLDRIPELADVLQTDPADLCGWALWERAPHMFQQLCAFGLVEEAPYMEEGSAA